MEKSQYAKILQFLEHNPGYSYTPFDIGKEIEVDNYDSIGTTLSKMANDENAKSTGVVRVGRGLYQFVGRDNVKGTDGQIFEQIGVTKGGNLLIQSDDRTIYVARPISDLVD